MNRRGVALLAVLWVVTLLGSVAGVGVAAARTTQRAARNRIALTRGRWAAEACLAILEARWATDRQRDTATINLGRSVACRWRVDDPTARLNVNTVHPAVLSRLLVQLGASPDAIAPFVTHVVETRRDRPFTDPAQLLQLPGADAPALPYLTADGPGVVNASAAAPTVLQSLPGLTAGAVQVLVQAREAGRAIPSLDELAGALTGADRDSLLVRYATLASLLRFAPTQLVVTTQGWVGNVGPDPKATIEVLVVPLPERLAVLRRRLR